MTNSTVCDKLSDLMSQYRNWKWWRGIYIRRFYSRLLPKGGVYVYDESWDNLIILDACRYDTFRELNKIQGLLEYRISRGSSSEEFLLENFTKHPTFEYFPDLIYIAANPYVSSLVHDRFYKLYPVWDYGWDEKLGTVPPSNVVNAALEATRSHPDKRLIIHFMQPHFPSLEEKLEGDTGFQGLRRTVLDNINPIGKGWDLTAESLLDQGKLNVNQVWSAYKQNLRIVLSYVEKLIPGLKGKTVITSDHGDLFGERIGLLFPFKISGHRKNFHVKQLVKVPWLIVNNEHKRIEMSTKNMKEKKNNSLQDEEKIRDRLRKLGYE
jgi:hypothetical protein